MSVLEPLYEQAREVMLFHSPPTPILDKHGRPGFFTIYDAADAVITELSDVQKQTILFCAMLDGINPLDFCEESELTNLTYRQKVHVFLASIVEKEIAVDALVLECEHANEDMFLQFDEATGGFVE